MCESAQLSPDLARQVRLCAGFSLLGLTFGSIFAVFYLAIGHVWGGFCVAACTVLLGYGRWLLSSPARLPLVGNLNASVLTVGFVSLSGIEGGLHGHAVAWLACVPLCACFFVGWRTGLFWCAVCLLAIGAFGALELGGVQVPDFCPAPYASLVGTAGYGALVLFMCLLGVVYEWTRREGWNRLATAHAQLQTTNAELERLNRERGEFLGIAAHDLRNPLGVVTGYVQLMQGEVASLTEAPVQATAALLEMLGEVEAAAGRMRDLVETLLSVQVIEEGRLTPVCETCRLDELAAQKVGQHQMAAARKQIRLTFTGAGEAVWTHVDRKLLGQVVDNLISNAVKYSPPRSPVTVRVLAGAATAGGQRRPVLEVQDQGPGISEEDQRRLFGRFARLSARPTGGESSHGLGLSIAKRLVEALGGEIACRSQLGQGATFVLTLPPAKDP